MHHPLTSEVLSRFHRTLVEEIRSQRPEYLSSPFTVAEIYQDLVPYRTHRDRIGVEMNGDYEDALLRLLAGEGDYLILESDHARRELEGELESSNPNTGLFREFAAADVRLNPARLPASPVDHLFGDSVLLDLEDVPTKEPVPVEDLAPSGSSRSEPDSEPGPRAVSEDLGEPAAARNGGTGTRGTEPRSEPKPADEPWPEASPAPAAAPGTPAAAGRTPGTDGPATDGGVRSTTPSDAPESCRWCREPLPRRDTLNYCPFCGANAHLVPCPNCGEELEPSWRYCVACGTEAAAGG